MKRLLVLAVLLLAAPLRAQSPPPCPFGQGDLPAVTLPPGTPHGAQIPIDNIVVIMQENRAFDHYFGQLHRQGQPQAEAEPKNASNPDPTDPTGPPIGAFHQTRYCECADLDHSWNGTHREYDNGAMDGFTAANVDTCDPTGSRTMGFYDKNDLPFYYGLYKTFAIGDRFFCSALTQTFPNRARRLATSRTISRPAPPSFRSERSSTCSTRRCRRSPGRSTSRKSPSPTSSPMSAILAR